MNVICKNYDYTVKEFEDHVEVHNSTYDIKYGLLFLLSMLEFFSPDSDMYEVPVTIIIPKNDSNSDADIFVDKKLRVHGTDDYEVVINKSEYDKWKKSYLITNILTIIVAFLMLAFALTLIIPSDMNVAVAAVLLTFFLYLPAALIVRLFKQLKKVRKLTCSDNK